MDCGIANEFQTVDESTNKEDGFLRIASKAPSGVER
jgi:hypothetical protein